MITNLIFPKIPLVGTNVLFVFVCLQFYAQVAIIHQNSQIWQYSKCESRKILSSLSSSCGGYFIFKKRNL
jgi:hypothetical protein